MADKIRIEGESWRDNRDFDAGDLLLTVLTGGLYPILREIAEPRYTVTVHTDHGDFVGHGNSIDEARENALNELKKHL